MTDELAYGVVSPDGHEIWESWQRTITPVLHEESDWALDMELSDESAVGHLADVLEVKYDFSEDDAFGLARYFWDTL